MVEDDWVELATAIQVLRDQLAAARDTGQGQDIRFEVAKVEVEFAVEAKKVGGGGLGVKFGVISVDGKGERSSGATHRLRLELTPRDAQGQPFEVSGTVAELPPA